MKKKYSAQDCYAELRDSFLNHKNDNDAKAKEFRTTLERFFNSIIDNPRYLALAEAQEEWYQLSDNYQLNKIVSDLRAKFNGIVHGYKSGTSDAELSVFFKMCIQIICIISGEDPDEQTKAAYGIFDATYLNNLNEQQRDAVLDKARVVYVNAGPGTGKTHLLVYKILDTLVNQGEKAKIVSMSYTRSSAASLSEKLEKTINSFNFQRLSTPYTGTIHSFCLNSLKAYKKTINEAFEYIIADESEIEDMAEEIYHACNGKNDIEIIKQYLKSPDDIDDLQLKKELGDKKKMFKRMSVNEILSLYLNEISTNDSFIKWTEANMNYLLVDEAQDLTVENYKIFHILLDRIPELHLFLVGDPRQNIFSFLGGSYQHLNSFLDKYSNQVSRKYLSQSYRCPSKVLDYVNQMRFTDCENIPLESKTNTEGEITVKSFPDEYLEANAIVDYIKECPDKKNVAILTSTMKPIAKVVDSLNQAGIPFVVQGGNRVVKPYINAFYYFNKLSETDLKSFTAIKFLCGYFNLPAKNFEAFSHSDVGREYRLIHDKLSSGNISYVEYARQLFQICVSGVSKDTDLKLVHEDFKSLGKLAILSTKSPASFTKIFRNYKKQFSTLEAEYNSLATGTPITISTIHSAKGLEWDNVIMPCMCDRYFPNPKILENVDHDKQQFQLNDELKKMFVAATRTKSRLFITYPNSIADSSGVYASPSRFLADLLF